MTRDNKTGDVTLTPKELETLRNFLGHNIIDYSEIDDIVKKIEYFYELNMGDGLD